LFTNFKSLDLVKISQIDKKQIIATLEMDTNFLESKGIMDYSLLLAIEEIPSKDNTLETE
jgi:hypothetical protein